MEQKHYITLWYLSNLFFPFGLMLFVFYLLNKRLVVCLIASGVCFVFFSFLNQISKNKLKTAEGYTVLQAISYYNACCSMGSTGSYQKKDMRILSAAAKKRDFLKNLDNSALMKCFSIGKNAVNSVSNPLLRLYWSLRKGDIKVVR